MAKNVKVITKMSTPLTSLLTGHSIVTSYDSTNGKLLGTSKDINAVEKFNKQHDDLMVQLRKKMSQSDMEIYNDLCREYNMKLIDIGYGMKRSAFKKLDFIDLRSLPTSRKNSPTEMPTFDITSDKDYIEYIKDVFVKNDMEDQVLDNALCLLIPPFTEFGFCFTPSRYAHMKVTGIDMIEHTVDIMVQDYTANTGSIAWIAGTRCDARISISHERPGFIFDPESYVATINTSNASDPHVINNIIPLSEMHWNEKQKKLWRLVDDLYSKKTMDVLAENGRSSYVELVRYILHSCVISNYMLHANKPVIQREMKEKAKQAMSKTEGQAIDKQIPDRRTRSVGLITVKSVKPPKRATPNTVRKWKVATWKARGGIRHMADGRVIPFKECVKHRKALSEQSAETVLPVTLKMRDNRPKE